MADNLAAQVGDHWHWLTTQDAPPSGQGVMQFATTTFKEGVGAMAQRRLPSLLRR